MRRARPKPLSSAKEVESAELGQKTVAFRTEFHLSITEFVDLLKRHGCPTANPVSLHRWEKRSKKASLVHHKIVTDAMEAIRAKITEALEQDAEPRDDILRLVVARLRTSRTRAR